MRYQYSERRKPYQAMSVRTEILEREIRLRGAYVLAARCIRVQRKSSSNNSEMRYGLFRNHKIKLE